MMLPATRDSCLKYIHINISIYVGTGTWYIDTLNDLYPKTSAGNTRHITASATFVAQTRGCPPTVMRNSQVTCILRDSKGLSALTITWAVSSWCATFAGNWQEISDCWQHTDGGDEGWYQVSCHVRVDWFYPFPTISTKVDSDRTSEVPTCNHRF